MISCQKHEISPEQIFNGESNLPLSHRKYWTSLIASPGSQAKKNTLVCFPVAWVIKQNDANYHFVGLAWESSLQYTLIWTYCLTYNSSCYHEFKLWRALHLLSYRNYPTVFKCQAIQTEIVFIHISINGF